MHSLLRHRLRTIVFFGACAILSACGGSGGDDDTETTLDLENPSRATALSTTTTWSRIANEYESFSVSGTRTVRYGSDTRWVQKSVSGAGQCTNGFFGRDPAPGVTKSCQAMATSTGTPPATAGIWKFAANEDGKFTLASSETVRYGAGTKWVSKKLSGSVACANGTFGDPLPGTRKTCEIWTTATTPTAPVSPETGEASLTWTVPTTAGVTGTRIYYGETSKTYKQAKGSGISAGTASSYAVTGLESGTTYYFAVTSIDAAGNESSYSNEASMLIK